MHNLKLLLSKTHTQEEKDRPRHQLLLSAMPQSNVVPKEEQHIYNQLLETRSTLSHLKKDRTQFLNSKDVQAHYDQVLSIIKSLTQLRTENGTLKEREHTGNKVDQVIDDILQLLSLFFITVGLIRTAPATFASLITVHRLLEHLNESKVYTHHDLSPIKERLNEIKRIIDEHSEVQEDELDLLKSKLEDSLKEYNELEKNIEKIDPDLNSLFEKLINIRRNLLSLASRPETFDRKELDPIKAKLSALSSKRDSNGKFQSLETSVVKENGQNVLNGLLDDCHNLIQDLTISEFKLQDDLKPIYEQLIKIKSQLEDLLVTRRWTLRETDLYSYQKQLQEIDDKRINGKFPTSSTSTGSTSNDGQSVLLYLLRRCYAIIYKLLESSEPVSEALQPIHNQLSTVRRCLLEVKRMGGVNSSRELYPYQMKLASLDNLRQDGKFIVNDHIPEGQGTLNALLAECYDICQELQIEAEEAQGDNDEEEEEGIDFTENNLYDNDDDDDDEEEDDIVDDDEGDDDEDDDATSINEK